MEESDPPDSYSGFSLISKILSIIFVKHRSLEELVSRAKENGNKIWVEVKQTEYNGKYYVDVSVRAKLFRYVWNSPPFSYDGAEILSKTIARKFKKEGIAVEARYER